MAGSILTLFPCSVSPPLLLNGFLALTGRKKQSLSWEESRVPRVTWDFLNGTFLVKYCAVIGRLREAGTSCWSVVEWPLPARSQVLTECVHARVFVRVFVVYVCEYLRCLYMEMERWIWSGSTHTQHTLLTEAYSDSLLLHRTIFNTKLCSASVLHHWCFCCFFFYSDHFTQSSVQRVSVCHYPWYSSSYHLRPDASRLLPMSPCVSEGAADPLLLFVTWQRISQTTWFRRTVDFTAFHQLHFQPIILLQALIIYLPVWKFITVTPLSPLCCT